MHKEDFYTLGPFTHIHLGSLSIPTYYFIISFTCCVCVLWLYKRCESFRLSQKRAMDLSLIILVTGFIGARLTHILFEQPSYYLSHPIEVFYFWQGGFVFYGGALLAYLCALTYIKRLKFQFWVWHDALAPIAALGYAIGRLACFMTGCCYGKVCELPWAFPLKQLTLDGEQTKILLRHPTPLYASGLEILILLFLLWLERKKPRAGVVFSVWVLLHSTNRWMMEIFRDDPRGPQFYGLTLSMAISVILFITALWLLWDQRRKCHFRGQ